jgi:hypothetical protein
MDMEGTCRSIDFATLFDDRDSLFGVPGVLMECPSSVVTVRTVLWFSELAWRVKFFMMITRLQNFLFEKNRHINITIHVACPRGLRLS